MGSFCTACRLFSAGQGRVRHGSGNGTPELGKRQIRHALGHTGGGGVLGAVDKDESLREAVLRAESIIHTLAESEYKRELTVAVAHALAAVGETQEAANELQAALLPGSEPSLNGARHDSAANGKPIMETVEGRFTDPTAGIVAPKSHRRVR